MSISKKIQTIDDKIGQNKAQYNLNRQAAKVSALLSGNASKYEFVTGQDALPEKDMLQKAATIKRFEYCPLGKELKKQTSVAEKQYQKLESNKKEEKVRKNRVKSGLYYCRKNKIKSLKKKSNRNRIKGTLSGLRQFLAAESSLKMTKNAFISRQKLFPFSRYLSFCLDFLVM